MKKQWSEFKTEPKYSVMRIERAKQKALTGENFGLAISADSYVMDWTGEDEEQLCELIADWDKSTGHKGLNDLIDGHQFSGGKQCANAQIGKLLPVDLDDGRVRYVDTGN